jgi:hypothetical protein
VWIDELYTADCVRQQGVARWLIWQVGRWQRIELQVSTALTAGGGGTTLVYCNYDDGPAATGEARLRGSSRGLRGHS